MEVVLGDHPRTVGTLRKSVSVAIVRRAAQLGALLLGAACVLLAVGILAGCAKGGGRLSSDQPTWQRLGSFQIFQQDGSDISISFADSTNGWLIVSGGRLLHTADGGRSWKPEDGKIVRDHAAGSATLPRSMAELRGFSNVRCVGSDTIWVAHGWKDSSLLLSRDAGVTWRRCETIDLTDLCVGNMSWVGGSRGWVECFDIRPATSSEPRLAYVFETKDGGRTWRRFSDAGWSDAMVVGGALSYDDVGFTVAPTLEDGFAWQPVKGEPDMRQPAFRVDSRRLWQVGGEYSEFGPPDGTLAYTDNIDSGITGGWHYDERFKHTPLKTIFFSDESNGWVVGDEGVLATHGAGTTWQMELKWPTSDQEPIPGVARFCRVGDTIVLLTVSLWSTLSDGSAGYSAVVLWSRPVPAPTQ